MKEYYSPKRFAQLHNVSETTVRQWIRIGKIRTAIKVGNTWDIPADIPKPSHGFLACTYYIQKLSEE